MKIRPAVLEDAAAIANVHVTSWHETYSGIIPDSYLAQLDINQKQKMWVSVLENNCTVFVAETGGKIIGFANASNNNDAKPPYLGEILTLYVLKAAHKVGAGKQLFQSVKEDLLKKSLFPFVTYVLADNPALGFYQRMGAEVIGEHLENFDGVAIKELQLLWK